LATGDKKQNVPVKIIDGFPEPLWEIVNSEDERIWRLMLNIDLVRRTQKGLGFLLDEYKEIIAAIPEASFESSPSFLEKSQRFVDVIVRNLETHRQIRKQIQEINADILGAYFFRIPEIQLYWMAIGLLSSIISVSPEALTVVVLTHELAHAYHHCGYDIDGNDWNTLRFAECSLYIVEGLAQVHTQLICQRMADRFPEVITAFERLCELQSPAYVEHKKWLDDRREVGEVIRASLIESRSTSIIKYEAFIDMMDRYEGQLGKSRSRK